jgi:hypothetical protein
VLENETFGEMKDSGIKAAKTCQGARKNDSRNLSKKECFWQIPH